MHLMEERILKNIQRYELLNDNDVIIVALSGGADSVALLAVLVSLGYKCVAAHCNFHLRGEESDRDEAHARLVSTGQGVECEVKHFDVSVYENEHGVSTEMACRELRYAWFEQLRVEYNAQAIAVAHHRDDDIETMFLNLLRGSGIAGVAAMKWRNGYVVRPMLNSSRNDIEMYLKSRGLKYIVDSTNAQINYKRNRLRNVVLPALREMFPNADEMLAKSLSHLKENWEIYNSLVSQAVGRYRQGDIINLMEMVETAPAPATMLYEMLYPMGFNITQVNAIVDMVGQSGKVFYARQWVAVVNRRWLQIVPVAEFENDDAYNVDLSQDVVSPIQLQIKEIPTQEFKPVKDGNVIYLDAKVLSDDAHFVIRRWRNGDRIAPFGMSGTKKLSDLFSDAKLSVAEKQRVWVLERNNEILWVIGIRASRHFKVTKNTTSVLQIKALYRSSLKRDLQ